MKYNTLYMIRGLPGSGKSRLAKVMALSMGIQYYEADQWFVNNNEGKFNPNNLSDAHEWCQNMVRHQLLMNKSVIVSNTSTTQKEIDTYQNIANEYGAIFVSIIVENRHGNKSIHGVPADTMRRMKDRFDIKL